MRGVPGTGKTACGSDADEYNVAWREYLQAIYYLGLDGGPVISARLAEWLGISPAAVAEMLRRMQGVVRHRPRRCIQPPGYLAVH